MTYRLRQSRDGAIEFVDSSPVRPPDGKLSSLLSAVGWETALLWYMRTLAWVWVGKGLFNWAIILGAFPGLGSFTTMTLALQATIVAFACFDLLAAVGLLARRALGRSDLALVRRGGGGFAGAEFPRRRDRLFRRRAQHCPRRRLLSPELARGAGARLTQD